MPLHAGSVLRFYGAKLLLIGMIGAALACFATAYPVLLNRFDRPPEASELLTALTAHIALAWLGNACAFPFNTRLVPQRSVSLTGLLLVLALSLAGYGLRNELPAALKGAARILPPAFRVMDALLRFGQMRPGAFAAVMLFAVVYALSVSGIAWRLLKRRLF
ncbi:hypothetical protein [Cohnella laeviribosi]|uniref:hypothetical protein n=1 Tax=Cohnella laeviribosi TaxID=380174 RepID=UPI00039D308F|nr:hypothetical protein [Cohnella laeviribosi]